MTDPLSAPSAPSWADRLARWRSALPRPLPRAAAVAAGAVVAAVAGGAFLLTRASPPAPIDLPRAAPATTTAGAPPSGAAADGPPAAATVTVHAAGAVARPGVYVLPAGARVVDAVAAAGGARPDADLDQVNLAAKAGDAERIYVPRKGESPPPPPGGPASGPAGGGAQEPLDLNAATPAQLDALPGIGPALAQAIVEYRTRHGRFRAVGDLVDVPGIGPAKLASLRPLVRV